LKQVPPFSTTLAHKAKDRRIEDMKAVGEKRGEEQKVLVLGERYVRRAEKGS